MRRVNLLEKDSDAWKDWGQEEKGTTEDEMVISKLWEMVKHREAWCAAVHRVAKSETPQVTEQQQQIEANWMSIDRGVDKEDVVHRYNGIHSAIKKNKKMPFIETWMDLEIAILSQVS